MTTLIDVQGLKKYFPITKGLFKKKVGDVKAVDGIDLSIAEGEVVALVGESGSGKSTAGRAMIRLIEPTAGTIFWRGHDLMKMDGQELMAVRRETAMIFQDPYGSLNPRRPVVESIGEGSLYHGLVKTEREKRERVAEGLHAVGLSADVMDRYPHQFSGGQQQRICIARALALSPRLIICDEALSALDVSVQAQVLNLLQALQAERKLSYLFISHDLAAVRKMADYVVVLYLGQVMEAAPADELFANPKHPYTQALLSATPKETPHAKSARIILKGEMPSASNPPSGCPFRTRCPYAQEECAAAIPKKRVGSHHTYSCILD